ncbi:MAG: DUF2269 domain-containing protein [Actinobacteria bacterium]|nr:DUF2269 domain-containing protein [Actinomycetota bacterium]
MGVDGELYRLVLLLHIGAVVVGFGGIALNRIYGTQARRRGGSEGVAIGEANLAATRAASSLIYLVPVFGIALVLLSDGTWGFDQPWISVSFLLYLVAAGLLGAVVVPSQKRISSASGDVERLQGKLAAATAAVNLLFVAVLALMIWKPGA